MADISENTPQQTGTQLPISKLDALKAYMKKRNPDKEYASDDDYYDDVVSDFDKEGKELNEYRENGKKLSDLFASDPRSATFLTSWKDGQSPLLALLEIFGQDEIRAYLDDPSKLEEIKAANQKYLDRLSEQAGMEKETEANVKATLKTMDDFQAKYSLSDDEMDNIFQQLDDIASNAIKGKVDEATFEMIYKAQNHDADVAAASHEGEVRGKNTKIEEKLRKEKQPGMPADLGGRKAGAAKLSDSAQNLAKIRANSGEDIWDRG